VSQSWDSDFESRGYAVVEDVLNAAEVQRLRDALNNTGSDAHRRGGRRNILQIADVQSASRLPAIRAIAERVVGLGCFAVRGLLFDKTPTANWRVAWHQDVAIATKAQASVDGFGPWTVKAGVPHCHAPARILEQMVAIRVHLEACGPADGPLRVLPGSHASGRLDPGEIEGWKARSVPSLCVAGSGGVVVMRPLLVHASSSAERPDVRRRVVHLEFTAAELPGGLEWAERLSGVCP